jgi:hypothetical protein
VSFDTGGLSGVSSLKQTHWSPVSSIAAESSSGPKMLSTSAIDGFFSEPSASAVASAEGGPAAGGEVGTFLGGSGGGVPVGKGLVKEDSGGDRGAPQTSDSDRTTSIFCSPKADSREGPNKAVVSSGIGAC